MVDRQSGTHAEHVHPMPHGGFNVVHLLSMLDHSAKEPTHAVSPLCWSRATGLGKERNKRIPFWAYCIVGVCPPVLSRQRFQQHFGLLEIRRVKPLGEPTVDRRKEFVRLCTLALLLPQPRAAHRRP